MPSAPTSTAPDYERRERVLDRAAATISDMRPPDDFPEPMLEPSFTGDEARPSRAATHAPAAAAASEDEEALRASGARYGRSARTAS